MFRAITVSSLLLGASAFITPAMPKARSRSTMRMSIAERELEAGRSAPFGDGFDPLGLSKNRSVKELKKWRESELKHGRVAMLAVLGTAVQENWHPLFGFNEKEMDGAIFHFQEIQNEFPIFWTALVFIIAIVENIGITKGWDPPGSTKGGELAGVREDYITGDLGFDPFNLLEDEEAWLTMRTKELNNGRLAMIAAAGITIQEKFVTGGLPEFEFHRFALSDVPVNTPLL